MVTINLTVNGIKYERTIPEHITLLRLLREHLFLRGTKEGCGVGECGACTVIMNGKTVNSCLVLAPEADGAEIYTVESLSIDGKLNPLQESFNNNHAVQCGFCTPGVLMSATDLLQRIPNPSEEEIKEAIEGNFCRCTGYKQIIEAIQDVANKK